MRSVKDINYIDRFHIPIRTQIRPVNPPLPARSEVSQGGSTTNRQDAKIVGIRTTELRQVL